MLRLQFSDYETLRAHGEQTYPHECCGVLLGRATPASTSSTRSSRPATPAPIRAHNRYNIAPVELIRIQRQARGAGLDIVGFYHSHPDHPAHWSPTDHRRSPLARLQLRHHPRSQRQRRRFQLLPPHRHQRRRQTVSGRADRDSDRRTGQRLRRPPPCPRSTSPPRCAPTPTATSPSRSMPAP